MKKAHAEPPKIPRLSSKSAGHPAEIKTTVLVPVDLWTRAKHFATDRRISLRDVMLAALADYLEKGGRRPQ